MKRLSSLFALASAVIALQAQAIEVPTRSLDGWSTLSFNNVDANDVSIVESTLHIAVDGSASPLVYKLEEPVLISGVTVVAHWSGELRIPAGVEQGDKGADDFVLKFGIVESGEQTLNWLQRRIAADWIEQLFDLAPKGSGVERILFLSTTQSRSQLGSSRRHPLNDLLYERRVRHLEGTGQFTMTEQFESPIRTLGLWISSDGDDTNSRFDLGLQRITLHTEQRE